MKPSSPWTQHPEAAAAWKALPRDRRRVLAAQVARGRPAARAADAAPAIHAAQRAQRRWWVLPLSAGAVVLLVNVALRLLQAPLLPGGIVVGVLAGLAAEGGVRRRRLRSLRANRTMLLDLGLDEEAAWAARLDLPAPLTTAQERVATALCVVALLGVAALVLHSGTGGVPDRLVDGRPAPEVPREIAAAAPAGLPVVGVGEADVAPGPCEAGVTWEGDPRRSPILVTTAGSQQTLVGLGRTPALGRSGSALTGPLGEPQTLLVSCAWDADGSLDVIEVTRPPAIGGPAGIGLTRAGGSGRYVADALHAPPSGAAWALQDQGTHLLAFPLRGVTAVRYRWSGRTGQPTLLGTDETGVTVLFVDNRGTEVARDRVSASPRPKP